LESRLLPATFLAKTAFKHEPARALSGNRGAFLCRSNQLFHPRLMLEWTRRWLADSTRRLPDNHECAGELSAQAGRIDINHRVESLDDLPSRAPSARHIGWQFAHRW
jgi:hypothetical protein